MDVNGKWQSRNIIIRYFLNSLWSPKASALLWNEIVHSCDLAVSEGSKYLRCCDLDINPMTLKLEGDLDILKMYVHTESEVVGLHGKWKNTKTALKIKGQGQLSPTSNHFWRSLWDIFLQSISDQ